MTEPLLSYENEDGEVWVPVEAEPDVAVAGQRLADNRGLAVVLDGRVKARTQECECSDAPRDHCPDDPAGHPCVVQSGRDCWLFQTFDPGWEDDWLDYVDEPAQYWLPRDEQGLTLILGHAWRPNADGTCAGCYMRERRPWADHYPPGTPVPGQIAISEVAP